MQSPERATLSRLAAIAALLAMPGLAMAAQAIEEFDIKTHSFQVLTTGYFPKPADSVKAGENYDLQCMFSVTGSVSTTTSTQIRFLVNGQLIQSPSVGIHDDQTYIAGRAPWTPPAGGNFTAKCEVNPNHDLVEASYANNQMTKQLSVSGLAYGQMDSAVIAAEAIQGRNRTPSRTSQIKLEAAKSFAVLPDIRVQGLDVHPVDNNGTPKSTTVAKGRPDRTYYLGCELDPVGIVAVSSVRFLFRVNGQIVKDAQVPVGSGPPVEVGAVWTPQTEGSYQLSCEANPQKTFQEASFANNKGQALFPVQAGGGQ